MLHAFTLMRVHTRIHLYTRQTMRAGHHVHVRVQNYFFPSEKMNTHVNAYTHARMNRAPQGPHAARGWTLIRA
jgi:hypothetical protein